MLQSRSTKEEQRNTKTERRKTGPRTDRPTTVKKHDELESSPEPDEVVDEEDGGGGGDVGVAAEDVDFE